MIFNSVTFLLFLAVVVACYYVLPRVPRMVMLLAASLTFYGFWRWDFVWLMVFSIVLDYVCGLKIFQAKSNRTRKLWLAASMAGNLGCLFIFKYLPFTTSNLNSLVSFTGIEWRIPCPEILLPLGISFYTFQTMSYTIDIYRGFIRPERNIIVFGTYVTFFPQLIAGPILRATEVIPYLKASPKFLSENLITGVRRILNGLFLKVVLADNLAEFVDAGFAMELRYLSAIDAWTLAFLFGFQIYFDFSAYSQIALGSAKLMGIDFPENFNFPYFSTSPREFWKRWHISLSSWIRDYLYLPLCGVKVRDESVGGLTEVVNGRRLTFALFATWSIMGMWHGANWTFLYWGILHATWILAYRLLLPTTSKFPVLIRSFGGWAITLLLAMSSWIPFRADSVKEAFAMHLKMLNPTEYADLGMRENTYIVAALVMLSMCLLYAWKTKVETRVSNKRWLYIPIDGIFWGAQLGLVFIFLRPVKQFIYFQF